MKIKIEATFETGIEATDEQVFEWLAFNLGYTGAMSMENPLSEEEPQATQILIDDIV